MDGIFLMVWISLIICSAYPEGLTGSGTNPKTESKSHRIGRNYPASGAGLTYAYYPPNYARYNPYVSGFVVRPEPDQAGYFYRSFMPNQLRSQEKSEAKTGPARNIEETGALLDQANANRGYVMLVPVVWTPKLMYPKFTQPLRHKNQSNAETKAKTENSTLTVDNATTESNLAEGRFDYYEYQSSSSVEYSVEFSYESSYQSSSSLSYDYY